MDQSLRLSPRKILQYTLSLLAAAGLFWYLYREQDLAAMMANIAKADFGWITVSIVISMGAHLSRGIRWAIMLKPLGYRTGDTAPFLAVMVGYLANFVLPRMGEVSRCIILQRLRGVPFNLSFGAVIAERVVDLIMLILFTSLALVLEYERLSGFLLTIFGNPASNGQPSKWPILWALVIVGAGTLLGLLLFWRKIMAHPLAIKVILFLRGLKAGLLSIGQLERRDQAKFLFHTFAIWIGYFLTSYVLFFAMDTTARLDWHCALAVLAMSGISIVAPVQGGIGVYHWLVAATLTAYGIGEVAGKDFAFMAHGSQTLMFLVIGGACLLISLLAKPHPAQ